VVANPDIAVRGRIFRGIVLLSFLILGLDLFIMMIVQHGEYKDQALENRQVRFRVRSPRGRIVDRNGEILADNMYIADITVPAVTLQEGVPDTTLHRLLTWFDLPRAESLARLQHQADKGKQRLVLVVNASMPQIVAVEERGQQLPGVRVEARARRRYPHGPLFAHIAGYVGEVGQADIDSASTTQGYRTGDVIGKQGVERAYEQRLRGRNGVKLEEVNAAGQVVGRETVWLERVVPGNDVTLSLSLPLQRRMAEALTEQTGCGIAVAIPSGQVLAAFSAPSFDVNLLTSTITSSEWEQLVNDPAKPFFNRIVQATYPPASLYKTVTSIAGLIQEVVGPRTVLEPCTGGYYFGNRLFRCWKHDGHGPLDHTGALVNSCDVFYYQLGLRLTLEQLAEVAYAFGLGQVCTSMFPEEAAGNIPNATWYDERYGKNRWTRGVLLNNAIGQGELLVTPLQMAMLAARIATSGLVQAPSFVLTPEPESRPVAALPIASQHLDWCRRTLEEVVDQGTGAAAAIAGYAVAGKTGTAQNPHGEDHAWFMCYAPADDPEVAVVILVEHAGHGSSQAAPAAGQWLRSYFRWREGPPAEQAAASVPLAERGAG